MLPLVSSIGSNIYLGFWVVGLLFVLWSTRKSRKARIVGFFLLLAVWFLGTRPAAEKILIPIESQYSQPEVKDLSQKGVRQVVVLTGGGYPVSGEILSSAFPHASIYRFLGGLELRARLGEECRILFSGSAGRSRRDLGTAKTMEDLSLVLVSQITADSETRSGSTAEHSANVKSFVKKERFLLVTSAVHMPRAVRTFKRAGLDPIPYPVDFLFFGGPYGWMDWVPSVESLWKVEVGMREYLAFVLYTVMRW